MICKDQQRASRGRRNHSNLNTDIRPLQIQIHDAETGSWRLYASFYFQGEADACLDALRQREIQARILSRELVSAR